MPIRTSIGCFTKKLKKKTLKICTLPSSDNIKLLHQITTTQEKNQSKRPFQRKTCFLTGISLCPIELLWSFYRFFNVFSGNSLHSCPKWYFSHLTLCIEYLELVTLNISQAEQSFRNLSLWMSYLSKLSYSAFKLKFMNLLWQRHNTNAQPSKFTQPQRPKWKIKSSIGFGWTPPVGTVISLICRLRTYLCMIYNW